MTVSGDIRFDVPESAIRRRGLILALGDLRDVGIARVRLNGNDLGVTSTPPFRVEIRDPLRAQGNFLAVDVTNSWRNRLVGDREKPESARPTKTNILIRREWQLLDSGLYGPIEILASQ